MKRKFCCEASRNMYEDYYLKQSGGQMPVFMGSRFQRGHGLGSILSGLFRRIVPFFRNNAKNIATNLLQTGAEVVGDVFDDKKKFTDSLKERLPQGIKRTVQNLEFQSGSGLGQRRKCKRLKRDIFDRKNGIRSRSIL
jgi:hypothetical protein